MEENGMILMESLLFKIKVLGEKKKEMNLKYSCKKFISSWLMPLPFILTVSAKIHSSANSH